MKTYAEAQLNEVLRNHKHWLMRDCDGWENMRANLSRAYLSGAYLSRAYLSGANLSGADLSRANLSGADLSGANLSGADLSRANLSGAYLSRANLSGAYLSRADLSGANLSGANLSGADLSRAENVPFVPMACPDTGAFTGWKKASGKIVKLLIPDDARCSSATGRKCRCDKAIVLAIENIDGTDSGLSSIASSRDLNFTYKVGETAAVPNFCENRFNECAAGIHFFINRQEAVEYNG
mgnify:CR=1 FL=1